MVVAITMIYFTPLIILPCLVAYTYLFFFDKWSLFRVYRIEKKFTVKHINYIVKA